MFDFALNQFYLVWIAKPFNLHKVGYYNGDHILLVQYTSLGQTGFFCGLRFVVVFVCLFLSLEGILKTVISTPLRYAMFWNFVKIPAIKCIPTIINKYGYSYCMCHIANHNCCIYVSIRPIYCWSTIKRSWILHLHGFYNELSKLILRFQA